MRKTFLILILFFNTSYSQWEQVSDGLFGGSISKIIITDSITYAGTYYGGIFISTNWGKSWNSISSGLSTLTIHDMVLIDNYLFTATDDDINFSSDNGKTWLRTHNKQVSGIICIDKIYKNILAGDYGKGYGILYSTDFGTSWEERNDETCCKNVEVIKASGNVIFAGTWHGLFYSTNIGRTWYASFQPKDYHWIFKLEIFKNIIAVLTNKPDSIHHPNKIFISTDMGDNWTEAGGKLKDRNIIGLTQYKGILYAASDSNLYISTDNGKEWVVKKTPNNVWEIFAGPGHIFLSTFQDELFISTDDGNTWVDGSNGMTGLYVGSIFQFNNNLISSSIYGNYKSSNNGHNWSKFIFEPSNNSITSILQLDNNKFLACIRDRGVYKSLDKGNNWFPFNNGLNNFSINTLLSVKNIVFAANGDYPKNDGGIYKIDINDTVWQFTSAEIPDRVIHSLVNINTVIFAGTHSKGIFRSTNWGENWIKVNNGIKGYLLRFETMTVQNKKIFAGEYSNGLFASTDLGETWHSECPQLKDRGISVVASNDSLIFAASYWYGIYMSKDSGENWKDIGTGLLNKQIRALLIYDGYLYAGTNSSGVWRYKLN